MNHTLITLNKFEEVGYALKKELLSLQNHDASLDEFKQSFHKFGVVVDDGNYEVFNLYKKLPTVFDKMAESMAVTAITTSNAHYNDLNNPPELLTYQPTNDGTSSAVLKEDIFKRLETYQVDFKDIKKIPKSSVMGKMKDNMFVEAYEAVQKDISKLFNKQGVTTNYEFNKAIIKGSKEIDKYPIRTSVYVNTLISRRIDEGLRLEAQVLEQNSKLKTDKPSLVDRFKGIFTA